MPRKKLSPESKKNNSIEWICASIDGPGYVTDETVPYRPKVILCMDSGGMIVGMEAVKGEQEVSLAASKILKNAIKKHPLSPTKIRVSSNALFDSLSINHPELKIIKGATPEIDEVVNMMMSDFGFGEEEKESYLSDQVTPDMVASLFKAASDLFKLAPWNQVPSDEHVISLSIDQLGIKNAVISIIGQAMKNRGFIVFASLDDFEQFLDVAELAEVNPSTFPDSMVPHMALNYDRGTDISPDLRKEVAKYKWEVASSEAFPWIMSVDKDLISIPLTEKEYMMFEAICVALVEFFKEQELLQDAWLDEGEVKKCIAAQTIHGPVKVELVVSSEMVSC